MSKITSKDTKPELVLRKCLHRKGLRFRLHAKHLPGTPDLIFPKYNAAVQVRGCFWHQHSCKDGHLPKSRQEYWKPKLERNVERDSSNDAKLRALGWRLWVVWGCEISTKVKIETVGENLSRKITKT